MACGDKLQVCPGGEPIRRAFRCRTCSAAGCRRGRAVCCVGVGQRALRAIQAQARHWCPGRRPSAGKYWRQNVTDVETCQWRVHRSSPRRRCVVRACQPWRPPVLPFVAGDRCRFVERSPHVVVVAIMPGLSRPGRLPVRRAGDEPTVAPPRRPGSGFGLRRVSQLAPHDGDATPRAVADVFRFTGGVADRSRFSRAVAQIHEVRSALQIRCSMLSHQRTFAKEPGVRSLRLCRAGGEFTIREAEMRVPAAAWRISALPRDEVSPPIAS